MSHIDLRGTATLLRTTVGTKPLVGHQLDRDPASICGGCQSDAHYSLGKQVRVNQWATSYLSYMTPNAFGLGSGQGHQLEIRWSDGHVEIVYRHGPSSDRARKIIALPRSRGLEMERPTLS